ncbi:hypothetical protein SEA_GILDA_12 [Microbacterium phage Gilda]|uniref:Uncharacterized protein n=6 Tax=Krampusvirus krampus TaxID=2734242 RepID=A0A4Y6ESA8_9CAUD|nr:hypothetical protein HOT40_gp12 [Microbacterium phage Krampus]AWY04468.1 hypothetical protein SEA_ANNASERENA_12 [Microbacterium phage AnnaSerena]QCQ57374.1 hypothetical protein SEA_RACHELLA_12 [Microbacterium phage Rachella]QDF18064.1 hypothetical protein SEA_ANAKIN_12 [Microbacterium phage Anakin]QDF18146.1 hypothetical protein SEA_NARUTORUN_12 [Microbacterium phage NarutoRun]QNJ55634.1 hypothetical protein SEA_FREDDIEHG_11 [Microbacterium phage FreddieHg]QOC58671.1 hypothetical protein S
MPEVPLPLTNRNNQEVDMGGKPNPGTKKDRRLKENRRSKSRKKGKK